VHGSSYAPGGIGVRGSSAVGTTGWAGSFDGNVRVTGTLFKSAVAFLIDHPLDPMNKSLMHSCVESSDMMNITTERWQSTIKEKDSFSSQPGSDRSTKNIAIASRRLGCRLPIYTSHKKLKKIISGSQEANREPECAGKLLG